MKRIKNIIRMKTIMPAVIFLFLIAFMGFHNEIKQDNPLVSITSISDTGNANPNIKKKESESKLNGNDLYRENCSRCHQPPAKLSKEKFVTILKHMRTIANFTEDEQQALQDFLTK